MENIIDIENIKEVKDLIFLLEDIFDGLQNWDAYHDDLFNDELFEIQRAITVLKARVEEFEKHERNKQTHSQD